VRSPRDRGDPPLAHPLGEMNRSGRFRHGDHAAETRRPPLRRNPYEFVQEQVIPIGVGLSRTAEPCREDARRAAQRIHLEARIVGQGQTARGTRHSYGLNPSVLLKRVAALRRHLDRPDPVERQDAYVQPPQQRGNLVEFRAITGRNDQRDFMGGGWVCQGTNRRNNGILGEKSPSCRPSPAQAPPRTSAAAPRSLRATSRSPLARPASAAGARSIPGCPPRPGRAWRPVVVGRRGSLRRFPGLPRTFLPPS